MQSDYWDKPAFETIRPRRVTAPLVFNSGHSGRAYPDRFLAMTRLDYLSIRQSEDAYVDELFGRAPHLGCPLLRAHFPRAYLDVNREPWELDPHNPLVHQEIVNAFEAKGDKFAADQAAAELATKYAPGTAWYTANEKDREAMENQRRIAERALYAAAL